MASKPMFRDDEDAPRLLPDWHILEVRGGDALAFLQRQTMNDVAALADGQWHWNGLLSAKGRLQSLFVLLRRDAQTAWLLLPDQPPEALAALLRPFVLRSKLTLAPRTDLAVLGGCGEAAARYPLLVRLSPAADALDRWLGACGADDSAGLPGDDGRWKYADLAAGIPRLDAGQRDAWTPHMLSLDRLAAFSLKKGCYPGQEIVARTHYLGRAKRGLWRLDAASAITGGAVLRDAGGAGIGSVVASASADGRHVALAVAPLDAKPEGWQADGLPVKARAPGQPPDDPA